MGHLKWACIVKVLSNDWYGEYLKVLLAGLKKSRKSAVLGKQDETKLLTEELVRKLVEMADRLGQGVLGTLFKFSWEFLTRVQSEIIPLQAGQQVDEFGLPTGRHSGVYLG